MGVLVSLPLVNEFAHEEAHEEASKVSRVEGTDTA
eukprot:COSAG05_NODE_2123_length_3527_cov_6.845974_2_plen_35_part_00